MLTHIFGCFTLEGRGGRVILAPSGQRPGLLTLSCNAKVASPQQKIIWLKMSMCGAEKSYFKLIDVWFGVLPVNSMVLSKKDQIMMGPVRSQL